MDVAVRPAWLTDVYGAAVIRALISQNRSRASVVVRATRHATARAERGTRDSCRGILLSFLGFFLFRTKRPYALGKLHAPRVDYTFRVASFIAKSKLRTKHQRSLQTTQAPTSPI
jgi:hypothetical protein